MRARLSLSLYAKLKLFQSLQPLLNDADFAESNHFFKATRLFIAQAAQQSAHAAELTKVRSVVPPRSLVITP